MDPGSPLLVFRKTFYPADETALALSDVDVNPAFVAISVFRRPL
jgi:hypothetical protein